MLDTCRSAPTFWMFKLLRLGRYGILRQLHLEEALYRTNTDNWCIISRGDPNPAIVMGISGKAEKLIHVQNAKEEQVPVIKRFTGGGTVIVDENTIFVTFIGDVELLGVKPWPREIMGWTGQFYSQVFGNESRFQLTENDYCFGNKKFAGNAQAVSRNRFVHHTSFLWRYEASRMSLLTLPDKRPDYRNSRSHSDFLCTMHDEGKGEFTTNALTSEDAFEESVAKVLENRFSLLPVTANEAMNESSETYRISTKIVEL
ncbi:hypothetical protein AAMO2058_001152600 [Amorphochlora amoebiformis]